MTPKIFFVFKNEYEKMKKEESYLIDYTAWINGQYIMQAIGAAMDKKNKYPTEPFSFSDEKDSSENDAIKFEAFAISFNQSRKGGEVSGKRN